MQKKMKLVVTISILVFLTTIIAVIFFPICPNVNWQINKISNFELYYNVENTGLMGGLTSQNSPSMVYHINSRDMTSQQRQIIFDMIKETQKLDTVKQGDVYLETKNMEQIRIDFSNGAIFLYSKIDATYLDEKREFNLKYENFDMSLTALVEEFKDYPPQYTQWARAFLKRDKFIKRDQFLEQHELQAFYDKKYEQTAPTDKGGY